MLAPDPIGAAYLLSDLEDPYFQHTQWFVAKSGATKTGCAKVESNIVETGKTESNETVSVILLYTALKDPALLPFGDAAGIGAIVDQMGDAFPEKVLGMVWPDHDDALARHFDNPSGRKMIRMGLAKGAFIPCAGPDRARPMTWDDLDDLTALMEHYPGNYFEPAMFRENLYYGIRQEGRLVSAGGIHTMSPTHGVAAVGNIVTHGDCRRQGLALSCTSTLIEALLSSVDHVALNVEAGNAAAIACYERLGFSHYREYTEGVYIKKEV